MRLPLPHSSVLLLAALAACAPPAAIAPPPPPPPPEPVVVQLTQDDIVSIASLLQMEDARVLDGALAARLLESATPEVRARAALAIARIGDRAGTPLLLRALQDSTATVRRRAAFALGKMADSSATVTDALSAAALRDVPAVATEAVAALGRIAAPAGRAAIDSVLSLAAAPAAVRQEALLVAWRMPRDTGTMRRIAAWTTNPDAETRWRATYALARSYGPAALPALLNVVNDADERVRANAIRALRAPIADSAGVRERAFAAVLAAAEDAHAHVRINALRLLPAFRAAARTTPVLIAHLRDTDENVAVAAAQALGEAADPSASGALGGVARDPTRRDGLRLAALAAWVAADAAAARATALSWADSTRWLLRLHAVRALRRGTWADVGATLQRLGRDPHYLVAADALVALREAADSTLDLRSLYVEGLGAAHPLVRAAAARGLGRRNAIADFDLLLQAYDRARQDSSRDAALAVVQALGRVKATGVPVEHSFFLRFPQPPADAAVFRAIRDQLGEPPAAWQQPPPRPLPATPFYVDIVQRYVAPVLAGAAPPHVIIETAHGEIELSLAAADAPLTVHNFLSLIERGYYRDTRWHRVVPNFVIQDGDPRGDGSGGPGYAIRDEINPLRYHRGMLGMALSGPDTGGSQFFITHSPQPHLDGGYTIFGTVSAGMAVVDRVVQEDPILSFRVRR